MIFWRLSGQFVYNSYLSLRMNIWQTPLKNQRVVFIYATCPSRIVTFTARMIFWRLSRQFVYNSYLSLRIFDKLLWKPACCFHVRPFRIVTSAQDDILRHSLCITLIYLYEYWADSFLNCISKVDSAQDDILRTIYKTYAQLLSNFTNNRQ
jgi:hypothetical protein